MGTLGPFMGCDETTMYGVGKSLCFLVDISIAKPLIGGVRILIDKKPLWITIRPVEAEMRVEKQLCLAFKNTRVGRRARTKLNFDSSISQLRPQTWLIADLSTHFNLPWLVGCDLNEIFYNSEKKGGPPKSLSELDDLRNAFIDMGFMTWDLLATSLHGVTIEGIIAYNVTVEQCLDHFCADMEWSLLFLDALVSHIDFDFLDHLPIAVTCMLRASKGCSGQRCFQFENT
ncbi:hypothetical protein Cgig2_017489 [Carnegiea gigantea]|uniref:Uncharacterized protein n=1 Tax=Carnegiea gigantea TaxID=171969 RepID=A0A9Q1KNI1_9CARY|nr:hypothetical protein Cgig2_017489 [Carnegiea gigantea]